MALTVAVNRVPIKSSVKSIIGFITCTILRIWGRYLNNFVIANPIKVYNIKFLMPSKNPTFGVAPLKNKFGSIFFCVVDSFSFSDTLLEDSSFFILSWSLIFLIFVEVEVTMVLIDLRFFSIDINTSRIGVEFSI